MVARSRNTLPPGSPTVEITVLCVATFCFQVLLGIAFGGNAMVGPFALGRPFSSAPWTFVTSVYAHAGIGHLLGNLLLLLLLGLPLERLTTRERFHLFFLLTGMISGTAQILVTSALHSTPVVGASGIPTVLGASGAIFALLGYFLAGNRVTNRFLDRLSLPPQFQLLVFALIALVVTFGTASSSRVAIWGHFSGLLVGLLAGRVNLLRPG